MVFSKIVYLGVIFFSSLFFKGPTPPVDNNSSKYIAVKSSIIKSKLNSVLNSEIPTGYFIRIVSIEDDKNWIEIRPHNERYIFAPILIRNLARSKRAVRRRAILGLSFEGADGFRSSDLEFFDGRPELTNSYISHSEFDFIRRNSKYVVFSGAMLNTGMPIDLADFVIDGDELITEYFTFKIEGFDPCSTQESGESVLCRKIISENIKIIHRDGSSESRTIERPLVSTAAPCPPRWRPGEE